MLKYFNQFQKNILPRISGETFELKKKRKRKVSIRGGKYFALGLLQSCRLGFVELVVSSTTHGNKNDVRTKKKKKKNLGIVVECKNETSRVPVLDVGLRYAVEELAFGEFFSGMISIL